MPNAVSCASAPFEFQFQSNIVRTEIINGDVWFCASDVCSILGYVNSRKTIQDHCKISGVTKRDIRSGGQMREVVFINEPNLYRLTIRSKKPEAEKFEECVMEEVLPAIRKTGAYIHAPAMRPAITYEQCQELKKGIRCLSSNWLRLSDQWVYNHLRVAFQVAKFEHIPRDMFPAAEALIESKKEATSQFISFVIDARSWFEREVLGAGTPWTPAIQRQLTRQLKRQVILPPKVDWLALEKQAKQGKVKR